jgi:hypothetical protein
MNRDWPPIELQSVHFQFPGSSALPLLNPATNEELGAQPEWINDLRNEPAAYVRGSTPMVKVGLMARFLFVPDRFELRAEGPSLEPISLGQDPKALTWIGPVTVTSQRAQFYQLSEPLRLNRPLPDRIGTHSLRLRWIAAWRTEEGGRAERVEVVIGDTQHTVCTTGRQPLHNQRGKAGPYAPLVLWTSEWCAGRTGDKEICDAIIENLPVTNLRYGVPGWDVRYMLMTGGGMCGGWYQMFQQMAGCQGVAVETRTFRPTPPRFSVPLGKPLDPGPEIIFEWGAFSSCAPGLNQLEPSWLIRYRALFPLEMEDFPPSTNKPLGQYQTQLEDRYCIPIDGMDGHSINFLKKDEKTVYLYDPCFKNESIELDMPLPERNTQMRLDCDAPFRRQYLDGLFTWFLAGGLMDGQYQEVDLDKRLYGLSVKTRLIPKISIEWDF